MKVLIILFENLRLTNSIHCKSISHSIKQTFSNIPLLIDKESELFAPLNTPLNLPETTLFSISHSVISINPSPSSSPRI